MKKVLIPTKLDKIAADLLLAQGTYEVIQDGATPLKDLAARHPDAFALIVRSEKVSADIIDALPSLKIIVRAGAGYNTIDIQHARRKAVDVMNTPGANANAVAEEVIAMILADARHIVPADASTRRGEWEKDIFMGHEIAGKTIGILGLGNIGRLVAKRLSGFDMRILGFDPLMSKERAEELNVELTDIDTLFSSSDFVTLHVPENEETRNMISHRLLGLMKNGATLVNCARSGVIDEAALREARKTRKIRFLNDVYAKDAAGPKSVADIADIMLPHLGASTYEANETAARRAAEQLIELDQKGVTAFIVNRDIPDGLDRTYCELANTLARLCRGLLGRTATLKLVETSFYGTLHPFGDWLMVPLVAGIAEEFDRSLDSKAARKFLQDRGIDYVNREIDTTKRYDNSITVDITASRLDSGLDRVSVRGTVAEGILIVSRINEFGKLWFEPNGHAVMFLYDDRPGVLGAIGGKLASRGVNIEDVRNPHDSRTNRSLAIMQVNSRVPEALVQEIASEIRALSAATITL